MENQADPSKTGGRSNAITVTKEDIEKSKILRKLHQKKHGLKSSSSSSSSSSHSSTSSSTTQSSSCASTLRPSPPPQTILATHSTTYQDLPQMKISPNYQRIDIPQQLRDVLHGRKDVDPDDESNTDLHVVHPIPRRFIRGLSHLQMQYVAEVLDEELFEGDSGQGVAEKKESLERVNDVLREGLLGPVGREAREWVKGLLII